MINYQSSKPSAPFIMIDRKIDDVLSCDAYFLFIKLIKLAENECNSNKCLMKKTGLSRRRFEAAKKELVGTGYLETQQLWGNRYALYIGRESVKKYKYRKKGNNRYEQSELRKLKNDAEITEK